MTVYDTVGVPFPKQAEEFRNDKQVLKLIKRIEHDIEIKSDLEECISAIRGVEKLLKLEIDLLPKIGFEEFYALADGAVSHAIHLYAKAFNGNNRRRRLDAKRYLNEASDHLKSAHKFFDDFRDKHFAHAEMRINAHTLHVHPMRNGQSPITNVNPQINRTILCKSYPWEHLQQAAQFFHDCLTKEILENAKLLDTKLTQAQKNLVQSMVRSSVTSLVL